jgi:hypothetical protein
MHDRVLAAPENGRPGAVAHIAPPNRRACSPEAGCHILCHLGDIVRYLYIEL